MKERKNLKILSDLTNHDRKNAPEIDQFCQFFGKKNGKSRHLKQKIRKNPSHQKRKKIRDPKIFKGNMLDTPWKMEQKKDRKKLNLKVVGISSGGNWEK